MSIKVSVITVCRNSVQFIEQAMQSVLSQTYPNIEYLVVDGASEDGTQEIVERYRDRLAKFVSEPDGGLYEAMNKGIQWATGDVLYFLNSDDYLVDRQVIADVVAYFQTHSNCDFLYGDVEARSVNGDLTHHQPLPPAQFIRALICLKNCPIQPACFFKRDLFAQLGLFATQYQIAADYDWFVRLIDENGIRPDLKICYYPRTIVSYYGGGLSSDGQRVFKEVFAIQNQTPIFQTPSLMNHRVEELQANLIDQHEFLKAAQELCDRRLALIQNLEASWAWKLQKLELPGFSQLKKVLKQVLKR